MNGGLVLVTGANGFVGRRLCPALSRAGWRVRGTWVHNKPETSDERIDWQRVDPLGPDVNWREVLLGVTHVVHLAAVAHRVGARNALPDDAYEKANHLGTSCLARAALNEPAMQRFVFVSSIGAVGSLAESALSEDSLCCPDTAYGRSKLAAENATAEIFGNSTVEWCVLRPPLLYGPGNPGNMERLLKLIRLPLPLPLASVRNRRSFLYVDNFVNAIMLALAHPRAANRLFCLSDGEDLSTPELLRRLGRAANRPVRLFPCPRSLLSGLGTCGGLVNRVTGCSIGIDPSSVEKLCGSLLIDSSRFRRECGWLPPIAMDEGLQATIRGV